MNKMSYYDATRDPRLRRPWTDSDISSEASSGSDSETSGSTRQYDHQHTMTLCHTCRIRGHCEHHTKFQTGCEHCRYMRSVCTQECTHKRCVVCSARADRSVSCRKMRTRTEVVQYIQHYRDRLKVAIKNGNQVQIKSSDIHLYRAKQRAQTCYNLIMPG